MEDTASSSSQELPHRSAETDEARLYNQGLTPLHPPQRSLIRLRAAIRAIILLVLAVVGEYFLQRELGLSGGYIVGAAVLLALMLVFLLPHRVYRRWGYDMGIEQLRVLRGFLWRTDTIVPFNRIQHIDVAQGPLQRFFGLSTLIVHTAGTHNSIVTLPGLATADAEDMREAIKGHIRQDMI